MKAGTKISDYMFNLAYSLFDQKVPDSHLTILLRQFYSGEGLEQLFVFGQHLRTLALRVHQKKQLLSFKIKCQNSFGIEAKGCNNLSIIN